MVVLAKGLSEFKVLLAEGDGLSTRPQTIAYSAVDHQLIVSYNLDTECSGKRDCMSSFL